MKMKVLLIPVALLLAICLVVVGCPAPAEEELPPAEEEEELPPEEEVIELTFASPYSPPVAYCVAAEDWIEYIHEQTDGRVHITPYWGGSLIGKQEGIAELTEGVADIGQATPYVETGYEITNAMSCFVWNCRNPESVQRICQEIFEKFPEYQQEFPGLVVLGFSNTLCDTLMTNEPIQRMEDLEGKSYNADEPSGDAFIAFGAVAVKIPPPEIYTQIEKGLLDGICLPPDTLHGFGFADVIKYVNLDVSCPNAAVPMFFFNQDSFNSLPADIQEIFMDSRQFWAERQLEVFSDAEQVGIDLGKDTGVEFIHLPAAELERWLNALATAAVDRAEAVDAVGKPGTEILEEILRLVDLYS